MEKNGKIKIFRGFFFVAFLSEIQRKKFFFWKKKFFWLMAEVFHFLGHMRKCKKLEQFQKKFRKKIEKKCGRWVMEKTGGTKEVNQFWFYFLFFSGRKREKKTNWTRKWSSLLLLLLLQKKFNWHSGGTLELELLENRV